MQSWEFWGWVPSIETDKTGNRIGEKPAHLRKKCLVFLNEDHSVVDLDIARNWDKYPGSPVTQSNI